MVKYELAPFIRAAFKGSSLRLGFGSIGQTIHDSDVQQAVLDAAELLIEPHTLKEVKDYLIKLEHKYSDIQLTLKLLANGCLIPSGLYNSEDRHSRSLLYYCLSKAEAQTTQQKIENYHVAILGCGGIGNLVAVQLATAGIGALTLIDKDHIELSNLTRQIMFCEADCGMSKVSVLSQALNARNSKLKIQTKEIFIDNVNINCIDECDFIVLSGDQPHLLDVVNTYAIQSCKPYVSIGYVEDIACWGPFVIPGSSGCFRCQSHFAGLNHIDAKLADKCSATNRRYKAPSIGPINMIAASCATLDILKFLGGFGKIHSLNKRIGLWTHDLHFEEQDFSLNPQCSVCGEFSRESHST